MKGKITEIFTSIQGEGMYLGKKQIFVRFFGCNIDCKYCDTKLDTFKEYEPDDLFRELMQYEKDYHSISFTGGEPLFQKEFLKKILKLTYESAEKNYLETNGTLPEALKEVIDYVHIVAMDLKPPSSTGLGNFWKEHQKFLEISSGKELFLKTVICQSTLEADLREAINLIKKINKSLILVLQPNSFEDGDRLTQKLINYKNICLNENVSCRIIPQVHKILGVK
jgi:organic radical activating enzyme